MCECCGNPRKKITIQTFGPKGAGEKMTIPQVEPHDHQHDHGHGHPHDNDHDHAPGHDHGHGHHHEAPSES
ncbi:MAG: hypothetical protein AB1896_08335 [Thermodesulfobacteriota bacterium]